MTNFDKFFRNKIKRFKKISRNLEVIYIDNFK